MLKRSCNSSTIRAWFETYIEPRGDGFYSAQGVRAHIDALLDAFVAGTHHPCVIMGESGGEGESGAIPGRVNLKEIDRHAGTAEVGYRIAASQVGKGLATEAVRYLIALGRTEWQLECLQAYVLPKNLASAGFT